MSVEIAGLDGRGRGLVGGKRPRQLRAIGVIHEYGVAA
jgi:hypothetical protein